MMGYSKYSQPELQVAVEGGAEECVEYFLGWAGQSVQGRAEPRGM